MRSTSRAKLANLTTAGAYARLYMGDNCVTLNPLNQPSCSDGLLGAVNGLATFSSPGAWAVETTVSRLFAGGHVGCTENGLTGIWLWVSSTGTGYPDVSISGSNAPFFGIRLDGSPPPTPDGIVVEGADKSLQLSWARTDIDTAPDLAGYLVLCMRDDGQAVFNPGSYDNIYLTGPLLCGVGAPVRSATDPMVSAAGLTTAVEIEAPQQFQDIDPRFLCSDMVSPTQLSYRVGKLQDGIPYTVGVAAVDLIGNASSIRKAFVQSPIAGVDPVSDTDAGAPKLGRSGCGCHLARPNHGAISWMLLLLALARRPRRPG